MYVYCTGKLEQSESSSKPQGGETSKLTTLTKAIDAIQENSKSLETMGKIWIYYILKYRGSIFGAESFYYMTGVLWKHTV